MLLANYCSASSVNLLFQAALALEKFNNKCLLELHEKASVSHDPHMCDFLESKYLEEQVGGAYPSF